VHAPGVVTVLASAPRRRGRRDLAGRLGVAAAAASAPMEQGAPSKAVRGGGGSSPERRCSVEAVEDASGGGVQWQRGSSGDR
jgi:hypothetical protein